MLMSPRPQGDPPDLDLRKHDIVYISLSRDLLDIYSDHPPLECTIINVIRIEVASSLLQ